MPLQECANIGGNNIYNKKTQYKNKVAGTLGALYLFPNFGH